MKGVKSSCFKNYLKLFSVFGLKTWFLIPHVTNFSPAEISSHKEQRAAWTVSSVYMLKRDRYNLVNQVTLTCLIGEKCW